MSVDQFVRIASLSKRQHSYNSKIKARVTAKMPRHPWSRSNGSSGNLFNIELKDESGEIKAVMYNDKYYEMIQCGKVYIFSKFNLIYANKRYNTLSHAYEMSFANDGEVSICEDERETIPELSHNYVTLSQIPSKKDSESVNIIGICWHIGDIIPFNKKTSCSRRRHIVLIDATQCMVTLTLWNDYVDHIQFHHQYRVISMKRGYVRTYNGSKTIQTCHKSVIEIDPDVLECQTLRNWFDNADMRHWATLQQASSQCLEYFETVGLPLIVNSFNPFYKACTQDGCLAGVEPRESGYYCHKCDQTIPDFKYRLRLEIVIADGTYERTVKCFNDSAEQLFHCKAPDVAAGMSEDPVRSKEFFKDVLYKPHVFTLKVDTKDKYRQLILLKSKRLCRPLYNKYLCSKLRRRLNQQPPTTAA